MGVAMNMAYLWIFVGCYLVAFVLVVSDFSRKNAIAAARLREIGASAEHVSTFHKTVTTRSVMLLGWATFVFGSVAGGVVSLIYWLVS